MSHTYYSTHLCPKRIPLLQLWTQTAHTYVPQPTGSVLVPSSQNLSILVPSRGKRKLGQLNKIASDFCEVWHLNKIYMSKFINRVDNKAKIKVTTDTILAWVFIPEGILHTISPLSSSELILVEVNKQLWLCDVPSMLQHTNKSGGPNLTLE